MGGTGRGGHGVRCGFCGTACGRRGLFPFVKHRAVWVWRDYYSVLIPAFTGGTSGQQQQRRSGRNFREQLMNDGVAYKGTIKPSLALICLCDPPQVPDHVSLCNITCCACIVVVAVVALSGFDETRPASRIGAVCLLGSRSHVHEPSVLAACARHQRIDGS